MTARPLTLSLLAAIAASAATSACRVDGNIKAGASAHESRAEETSSVSISAPSTPPPPPPSSGASGATTTGPAPTTASPAAPPADACPLTCFEARGSERATLTSEEHAQIRSALAPTLARMRACTSPDDWRRRGSPVINLRVAPDGSLVRLGVDPHHDRESACMEDAANEVTLSVALPGRKVVRCVERCEREAPKRAPRPRR